MLGRNGKLARTVKQRQGTHVSLSEALPKRLPVAPADRIPAASVKVSYTMGTVASKLLCSVASLGVRSLDNAERHLFDRLLGVSTARSVSTENTRGDNIRYEACQWLPVRRMLKSLAPSPSDIFVDLGSGKGKTVLIAALLPYRRVVG